MITYSLYNACYKISFSDIDILAKLMVKSFLTE